MYLKVNTLLYFRYYSHLYIAFLYIFHNPLLRIQGGKQPLVHGGYLLLTKNSEYSKIDIT